MMMVIMNFSFHSVDYYYYCYCSVVLIVFFYVYRTSEVLIMGRMQSTLKWWTGRLKLQFDEMSIWSTWLFIDCANGWQWIYSIIIIIWLDFLAIEQNWWHRHTRNPSFIRQLWWLKSTGNFPIISFKFYLNTYHEFKVSDIID